MLLVKLTMNLFIYLHLFICLLFIGLCNLFIYLFDSYSFIYKFLFVNLFVFFIYLFCNLNVQVYNCCICLNVF